MPRRSAAPWLTTTASWPRFRVCAMRAKAAATRSATTAVGSPFGGFQLARSAG